jgi:Protein of unknown function (DUF3558)
VRLRFTVGIAAIVGVVLVGCSSTLGTPGLTSAGTTTSSTEALPPGTPNVAHPLDVTKFRQAPCSVLTAAQLQKLNVAASGQVDANTSMPGCSWHDQRGPSKMGPGVTFGPVGHGLADIYGQKSTYVVFQPLPDIDGYPAVIALSADGRSQGNCEISVGVSNQQFIDVAVTIGAGAPDETTPCTRSQTVAAAVVATVKG